MVLQKRKNPPERVWEGGKGSTYNAPMSFIEFKIWKAVALVVVVGLVCFFYALITGRSITEVRRDKEEGREK